MHNRLMLSLSAALLLSLGGCGDGDQGTTEGEASEGSTMDAVKEQAQAAMDSAAEAGRKAMDAASQAAGVAADRGEALTADAKTRAQELIDQVRAYLAENDLDSAEGIMSRLSALRDSLPEAIKTEIDELQQKIDSMRQQENG
jgi:polyhydroxyalkanoate synthesis regulator phasin